MHVRVLVAHLSELFAVAPGQVYTAGFSRGGDTVFRYDRGGGRVRRGQRSVPGLTGARHADRAVSVIALLGLANQATLIDMEDGPEVWRTALDYQAGEPAWVDQGQRVSLTEAACGDGSEAYEYRVEGMTHVWPRTSPHTLAGRCRSGSPYGQPDRHPRHPLVSVGVLVVLAGRAGSGRAGRWSRGLVLGRGTGGCRCQWSWSGRRWRG
jgi:poly(3-hydroxybutyrate) depolymerase